MKIKFKSECCMKNFMTHGMDSGVYNHNKAMVETYQSLPFSCRCERSRLGKRRILYFP
ncbi:hypothetical protein 65p185 [Aeromonas phage 65]|uniref:Uncharacterized protein n=1 Tax=Aeromonas phage 65 TaxID=2919549 RepID=E5DS19_9CAUD|nr:hypothetical protein ST65p185 [Aeromonas phage 65]ADQ53193.1 hypothetical protein 65p185 [Aeromonas phage 65]